MGMLVKANSAVLTFDDINPLCTNLCGSIGTYGGLLFGSNFNYLHSPTHLGVNGYDNGTFSGEFVAYNHFENTVVVTNSSFDFTGAYLTGAWNDGLNVNVIGKKLGATLYDTTVVASQSSPTWFQFDYVGIDELIFSSSGGTPVSGLTGSGTHFAMDDFTINAPVVPEPISSTLFIVGGATLGFRRFRRKFKK
jgi:hypothetical protein